MRFKNYTYKVMNNIDSNNWNQHYHLILQEKHDVKYFYGKIFPVKLLHIKNMFKWVFQKSEPGPSEFPELDPSTGGNLADGPSLNLGGAQTAL